MPLTPGTRLGPYEIAAAIGAGGMGEVYRARDTKLDRNVAIKVLPESFALDADRVARFTREAKTLAALNHPNIAQVFGVEEQGDTRALVMELVEGEDLSEVVARGPMAWPDALPVAKQIAEALEAAHEQGIIHRDLKPANIKVRADGTVKVLDFGLAKALGPDGASATAGRTSVSMSPTITTPAMTQMGMILGTAAYMSPEQAKGRAVDRRADVWAFGAVLYEMLTGQRAFAGDDITETLADIMRVDPDWTRLPHDLLPSVATYLKRSLHKDPKQRIPDVATMRLALDGAFEIAPTRTSAEPAAAAPGSVVTRALPWAVAAMLAGALAIALWAPWRSAPATERPLVRANLDLAGFEGEGAKLTLSPDGTRVAYVTRGDDGRERLATRLLAESEAKILPGTEGAVLPFFSPDGQWIGFGADGQLKKVLALGGTPLKVTDAPIFVGGSWTEDGFIVATLNVGGDIRRIPEAGGDGEPLLPPSSDTGYRPQVLPGGKTVIFGGQDLQGPAVKMLSIERQEVSTLIPGTEFAQFLPSNAIADGGTTGHLVYRNGNTLLAVPFDPERGEMRGQAIPVLDDVAGGVSFAATGEVLYPIGATSDASGWSLRWLLPDGATEPLLEAPGRYSGPRVSPDGTLLAVTVDGDRPAETQLLVYDWRNDRMLAISSKGQADGHAVWTPDSRFVIWAAPTIDGEEQFLWKRADGSGETHVLAEGRSLLSPSAISPDGSRLALAAVAPETRVDLLVAPLDLSTPGEMRLGEPEPLVRRPGIEFAPVFSPDGRWVAYFSDESGSYEVYVQRFPGGGGHRQVSAGGGIYPKWAANGRQLLYFGGGRIMAVDYEGDGDAFVASRPRTWSPTPARSLGSTDSYGLDPTTERAVIIPAPTAPEEGGPPRVAFLLNFFDELRRKVPVER